MKALFGAGCFWGVQEKFQNLEGVMDTQVGYAGGNTENPTYQEVCTGATNHAEVCLVEFDENKISYDQLLAYFFQIHNPTTLNQQGYDIGSQYRSVIYYVDETQHQSALQTKENLIKQGTQVVTEISPLPYFWKAELYHQHYIKKSRGNYT
jgi:peptide-methionine (S)-S-oxide reductase